MSDFGADALTAAERAELTAKWEREHPGLDSSLSRLPKRPFPDPRWPLGMYPMPAPFTLGSKFVDSDYPDHGPFTVLKHGSSFGDDYLLDIAHQWHEPDHCRVVEYLSPEALEQRKQDRILVRLEAAYGLV